MTCEPVGTAVHDNIDTFILEGVKDSNCYFIVISVLMKKWHSVQSSHRIVTHTQLELKFALLPMCDLTVTQQEWHIITRFL